MQQGDSNYSQEISIKIDGNEHIYQVFIQNGSRKIVDTLTNKAIDTNGHIGTSVSKKVDWDSMEDIFDHREEDFQELTEPEDIEESRPTINGMTPEEIEEFLLREDEDEEDNVSSISEPFDPVKAREEAIRLLEEEEAAEAAEENNNNIDVTSLFGEG